MRVRSSASDGLGSGRAGSLAATADAAASAGGRGRRARGGWGGCCSVQPHVRHAPVASHSGHEAIPHRALTAAVRALTSYLPTHLPTQGRTRRAMDVGLEFLPDRTPDPAALAGEVLLVPLFGRADRSDGSGSGSDDNGADDDELRDADAANDDDGHEAAPAEPRTVYYLGAHAAAAEGGTAPPPPIPVRALPVAKRGIAYQLWPSALALCRYLEDAARDGRLPLQTLRCVELGAGLGTVGIAAALMGAPKMYLTDLLPVCAHMEANIAVNERPPGDDGGASLDDRPAAPPGPTATALPPDPADRYGAAWALAQRARIVPLALPWGADGLPVCEALRDHVDLILASDVVYWEHLHAPLLETLRALMAGRSTPTLMAHLRRRRADKHFFKAAARWFTVKLVDQQRIPTYRKFIQIYEIRNRPSKAARKAAAAASASAAP